MATYARDSLGVPVEIIKDDQEEQEDNEQIVATTFNGKKIYEDEEFLSHEAECEINNKLEWRNRYLKEKDIYEYIRTLRRNDLIEALEKLDTRELIDVFQMERKWL